MTLFELKQRLAKLKPELHEQFGVTEIGIFGSYARGEQKRGSDLDVLVSFDRTITLFGLYDLQAFLKRKFRKNVDVVMKNGLKEHIGTQILAEVQFV